MKTLRICFAFLIAGLLLNAVSNNLPQASGQDDFDRMFEEMMKEFFPKDLIDEVESIREKEGKSTSGKSFYRDDPRFLAIKEKQIRNRRKDQQEKQHPQNLSIFKPLASQYSKSVVSLYLPDDQKKRLALGTVVAENGLIVTKASELEDKTKVQCVSADDRKFEAKVVKVDETNDLALLKAEDKLTPIEVKNHSLEEGTLLVTVQNSSRPVALGTLAVKPRSIIGKNRGFLGVEPGPNENGVIINRVTRDSAAYRAGIQVGDVVQSINGVATRNVAELVREIGSKKKGDSIKLKINRKGMSRNLTAILDGRMMGGDRAARFEMMRRLGTILSDRRDEFPSVLEHDSPILPNDCGGPLVDLDGKVLGINIARAGRTSSYALPMNVVKTFVDSYQP